MNLLMILIVLFAILVSLCIVYIAWDISSGAPGKRKANQSGRTKEPEDPTDDS